jgi:uroporphyrinogen decarboxylase
MTRKERMKCAIRGEKPDRVPVMAQMATGHIYKNAGLPPLDYWCTVSGYAQGNFLLTERYKFDGILNNIIEMIDPKRMSPVLEITEEENGHIAKLQDGRIMVFPSNDNPRFTDERGIGIPIDIEDVDLGFMNEKYSQPFVPEYRKEYLTKVIEEKGDTHCIHGEVGTGFEMLLILLGSYENGLAALLDDPEKSLKLLEFLNRQVIFDALYQCSKGIDVLKLSSPFAGSGFISRKMYEEFVLPFERAAISAVNSQYDIPCYIHTCGKIGDRLDLLVRTGIDGIECLDPPPLGDVDLKQAVEEIGDSIFIKGNLDSVNELLGKSRSEIEEIIHARIEIGKKSPKGYILSTACSLSPLVPPENVLLMYECVEKYGKY